ncbi:MAG TPA: DUF92 domain-containing protein [Gemmatimonadales bacterium]|nr:DUF92 domain-containing protein [Gemmatimonadales bacterium]
MSPFLAAALAAAVAAVGWQARVLTGGGALAATVVGCAILFTAGWPGAAALAAFFVSSSAVSRIEPDHPSAVSDPKGNCRDQWQVIANGGPAALGALLARDQPSLAAWITTSSLAAAAADTWATAVGAWSPTPPRHLLTWRSVPTGTNGGVTLLGCLAALAGATLVAASGAWVARQPALLGAAAAVGFAGMVLDSALGASMQGRFRCPACAQPSERRVHRCGTPTTPVGGLAWLDNDGVNALATGAAALAGWCAWLWLARPSL